MLLVEGKTIIASGKLYAMINFIKSKFQSFFKGESTPESRAVKTSDLDGLPPSEKEKIVETVKQRYEEKLNSPPTIAIIGKTGVGKSSTINSLFSTKLGVSHFESCTQKAKPVSLTNGKGKITVYDMPGLGEDIDKDEEHKEEYQKILPKCDVVRWIMNIADREMTSQQLYIKEIMTYLEGRLVVCANKADLIHPNDWNENFNLPSEEQNKILKRRIVDIRMRLRKVVPQLSEDVIVYYSATKRYKLVTLFRAMLEACPKHTAWVLGQRIDLADFKELIDKDLLKKLGHGK